MIDLTPLEVRKKKGDFRRAMRGYDAQSVDDFLDLVADRLDQLVRENATLSERVTSTQAQITDFRDRERALTEALVTAQEMREQMRLQMEREAELKRREAEADAEVIRAEANQMREREEENIRRLRARQGQFVQSYRAFLEREIAELSVMTETLHLSEQQSAPQPRKRTKREAQMPLVEGENEAPQITLPTDAEPPLKSPEPEAVAPQIAQLPEQPAAEIPEAPKQQAQTPDTPPQKPAAAPGGPALLSLSGIPFEPEPFDPFGPESFDEFEREPVDPADIAESAQPLKTEFSSSLSSAHFDDDLLDLSEHFPVPASPEPSVQMDFDDAPPAEEEMAELELIDEVPDESDDDNDNDGWVSTLLEGKGD